MGGISQLLQFIGSRLLSEVSVGAQSKQNPGQGLALTGEAGRDAMRLLAQG